MNDDLLGYPARRLHTLTSQDVDVMKGRRFDGMACVDLELFAEEQCLRFCQFRIIGFHGSWRGR